MLHLRQNARPLALWNHQGWPSAAPDGRQDAEELAFWALNEVPAAALANDLDAVDDLLSEIEIWMDSVLRQPSRTSRLMDRADFLSIAFSLWGEVLRGRGAEDLDQIALHCELLQKLFSSPSASRSRPPAAVAPYVEPTDRITGGQLPLTLLGVRDGHRPLHEDFLLQLAAVLTSEGGHLSDYSTLSRPVDAVPERTGWLANGAGAAELLGSLVIGEDPSATELRLRPDVCVEAIAERRKYWSVDELGSALSRAWLIDTTLEVRVDPVRTAATEEQIILGYRPEPLWILPASVFHPSQFFAGFGTPQVRSKLRSVPDS